MPAHVRTVRGKGGRAPEDAADLRRCLTTPTTLPLARTALTCDDVFTRVLVFSEYAWIGDAATNAAGTPLPWPSDLFPVRKRAPHPYSTAARDGTNLTRRPPAPAHPPTLALV